MTRETLIKTVLAAQNGDNKAIELLFKEFNQQVYYSVLLTVKNEELAKDITQETFITVIRKIGELENPEAFSSWIKRVAHSKCSDYYKKKEVLHETTVSTDAEDDFDIFGNIEEDDSEFIPDQALDREDLKKIVLDILNDLPDVQRAAIFMRYYEDLSVKEIAEIQGVSEGTVMSRLNYGRKAIKKAVEDYEKENNIKLHALPFLPFFHWIFEATKNHATPKIIGTIANGVSDATGISISVGTATSGAAAATATGSAVTGAAASGTAVSSAVATTTTGAGLAAKIAAIPLVAKIAVPAVVAVTVLTPVAVKTAKPPETTTSTTIVETTEVSTTQEATTEPTTEETTIEETTLEEIPATVVEVFGEEPQAEEVIPEEFSTEKITVNATTTKKAVPEATKTSTTEAPRTTKAETTTKKPVKAEKPTPEEDPDDEDIYEIYEDGEELVEDEVESDQNEEDSPQLEIDGTTSPR